MNDYGYLVLFLSLTLGIMAIPIPVEALLGYAGLMSFQGNISWVGSILSAASGCTLGMIMAYGIGFRLGMPFFEKYGPRFHLGPERLNSTSLWFKKYGNKLLIVAFFIPGVRHITGYFSGVTRLPIKIFSLYSSIGSVIWVSTFILLGKMLGPRWNVFQELIKKYLVIGSIILATVLIVVFLLKKYKNEIIQLGTKFGKKILGIFRSRGRVEIFLGTLSLVTLGFIILMIGFIQDYLSHEIQDFDEVTNLLVSVLFKGRVDLLMHFFLNLGTAGFLLGIIFYTLIWILWKGRDKFLELSFLFLAVGGGEVYEELLRNIFHRLSPNEPSILERFPYSFPSEQSLMAFVIYGFFFFILMRHSKYLRVHTMLIFSWVIILLFIGTSRFYFHIQDPSQVAAGYVFGGVWLGLTTLLLEIFRMLTKMDAPKRKSHVRAE
jgi:membrane protein DedA with SNARE-associated domain